MLVLLVVAACIAAVFTVLAAQHLFHRGGPNLDEVAYDAQARALADGHLTLPAATHDPFFRPFLSGFRDDRVVFKYQPVWPTLIATSRGALGSTLPLRALLAAAGVVATYAFAWQLLDRRRVAIIAAAIVAVSPFTWIQSATLLGYQLSFVLGLAAAAAIVPRRARPNGRGRGRRGSAPRLRGVPSAVRRTARGVAGARVRRVRIARQRSARTASRLGVAGALPAALLLAAFNTIVMGAPWKLPFGVSGPIDRFGFGWRASFVVPGSGREGQVHYTVGRALGGMWDSLSAFPRFVVATPVLLLLAVFVVVRQRRDPRVWLLVGMIATLIVGYLSWWGVVNAVEFDLTRSLGPFYHYLALGPLAVLAAWGLVKMRWTPATIAVLAVLAIVWTVPATWIVLHDARDAGRARAAEVALTDAPGPRLVLEDPLFPGRSLCAHRERRGALGPARRRHRHPRTPPRRRRTLPRPGGVPRPRISSSRRHRRTDPARAGSVRNRRRRSGAGVGSAGAPGRPRWRRRTCGSARRRRTAPISDATWEITADELSDAGTEVAVGYRMSPDEFVECRYEGRRTSGDGVRVLEPCDGYVGYAFPDGRTAVSREDVSGRVDVSLQTAMNEPSDDRGDADEEGGLGGRTEAGVAVRRQRDRRDHQHQTDQATDRPLGPTKCDETRDADRECHESRTDDDVLPRPVARLERLATDLVHGIPHAPQSRDTRAAPTTGRRDAWSAA